MGSFREWRRREIFFLFNRSPYYSGGCSPSYYGAWLRGLRDKGYCIKQSYLYANIANMVKLGCLHIRTRANLILYSRRVNAAKTCWHNSLDTRSWHWCKAQWARNPVIHLFPIRTYETYNAYSASAQSPSCAGRNMLTKVVLVLIPNTNIQIPLRRDILSLDSKFKAHSQITTVDQ